MSIDIYSAGDTVIIEFNVAFLVQQCLLAHRIEPDLAQRTKKGCQTLL